jgi:hypothetical protein
MISLSFGSSGSSWLARRYWRLRWEWSERFKRWRLAYRFASRQLTEDEAFDLSRAAMSVHGCYPLAELSVESTLERAREQYGDNPALEQLVRDACARVWSKWSGDCGDTSGAAEDWAMNLVRDYADSRGIELIDQYELESEETEETEQ